MCDSEQLCHATTQIVSGIDVVHFRGHGNLARWWKSFLVSVNKNSNMTLESKVCYRRVVNVLIDNLY
jgi:hypothetical protein